MLVFCCGFFFQFLCLEAVFCYGAWERYRKECHQLQCNYHGMRSSTPLAGVGGHLGNGMRMCGCITVRQAAPKDAPEETTQHQWE